jgi:hypothetical protein
MKKVFIIHGWAGSPEEEVYKWFKQELEAKGFEVHALKMPNSLNPEIEEWTKFLAEKVGNPDKQTYFIGHSIGCQTILRYLEILPENVRVGGAVLIAPWVHLLDTAYEDEEDKEIAKPWLETPINWEKVKSHSNSFVAIFSDNDFCAPLSDKEIFEAKLNAKIIIEHDKGHFTGENDISKVPSALSSLLEISK